MRYSISPPPPRYLHAFFVAAGRPVVALGIFSCLLGSWGLVTTLQRDFFGAHAQVGFLWVFVLPGLAGLLAAQVLGELQHCSFTWPLPGVRWKIAFGFLVAGATVALIVGSLSVHHAGTSLAVLLAVGLIAYFLGSLVYDPLSPWVSAASVAVGLLILTSSAAAERLAAGHPVTTVALVTPAAAGVCLWRLFGSRTFRRKPFRPTRAMATSPSEAQRYQREKRLAKQPVGRPWRQGYLATDTRKWTRASFYEHWGDIGWADVLSAQRYWPAVLLVVCGDAAIDRGGASYPNALANVFYHAFIRPPDRPAFGEKPDPYFMIVLVISFIGAVLAFSKPAAVEAAKPYPLSRGDRHRLAYLANLLTTALFFLVASAGAFIIGQTAGWLAGFPLRLDFVPFFLRGVIATVIVLPAVFWIRLRTRSFQDRPAGERGIVTLLWLIALWIWVALWCFILPRIVPSPAGELLVSAALIALTQWLYYRNLQRHFTTADLV